MSSILTYGILQQRKRVLNFVPFVAPTNFDRAAQALDIYDVFERYYRYNQNARYIYSFTSAIATLTLPALANITYRWGETISGVNYFYDVASGTAFTAGSTKRYVIVICTIIDVGITLPTGSIWVYFGYVNVGTLRSTNNTYLKYIHFHNLANLISFYGFEALYNTRLTGILTFPNHFTTTSNGSYTFESCPNITGIDFANITTIRGSTFYNSTGITSVDVKSATSVGNNAFAYCSGITSLNLRSVQTIEYSAFQNCTGLTSLTLPNTITSIGYKAFSGCSSLTGSLIFPNTISTIQYETFYNCRFTGTLTIIPSITSIGEGAFGYNNFNAIDVSSNAGYHSHDDVLYEESTHTALHSIKGNTGSITFENDTIKIGNYCCVANLRTGGISIPNSVVSTGSYAFYNCTSFTGTLSIGSSLATIGQGTFRLCTGLSGTLTIPETVTNIFAEAFWKCNGFTGTLTLPNSITTINASVFREMAGITGLILGNAVTSIGSSAFDTSSNLNGTLTIPSTVTIIAGSAFFGCTALDTLTINSVNVSISASAFNGTGGFTELNLCANYASTSLTFTFSNNFSGASLDTSSANITSGTKTWTIGATNRARMSAGAIAAALARGITIV